ncbi:MAG: FAD-binding oxidoreductase [Anaerolineae bacterium]|jgi:glycine/D-amino acid oxidase-like deaminating enzyme|nr:FAD-binding oxidoreductase [Anaerolineae bacterium]MBT4309738.1 FAD-binding oxidoreductase [Anaerolineae bacterium]MBT4457959.1 FAD-binding oxidoreductase [Anaerolineae bacterium]MBT4841365.1 FAD-binding oxidoreductase [Anaerolineae bacterium]MBT6062469.1 FAD-binding oxidoreductase [Anaerolineae bacterium]
MKYFSPIHNRSKNLRPPDLYEYFVDNFWFKTIDVENLKINEPLRGSHKADIVIVGGGFTGLSSAYNIKKKFPEKKVVLLEGAFCGYGASGRNGGFCIATSLLDWNQKDPERREKDWRVSSYGVEQIKMMISKYDVDCDFEENGMLAVALNTKQAKELEEYQEELKTFGLESTLLQGKDLEQEIKSPLFLAGLKEPNGATLNPAKLAREMKRIVEDMGVEVRERTVVTRIKPGKTNYIDTELGDIQAPIMVMATNAYAHKLGFFKDRVFPVGVFQIVTEPLSKAQWESVGWQNKQGLSDMRTMYSYSIPTSDGRILMGGADFVYYDYDALSSGNDKIVTQRVTKNFFDFFPQLEGLSIDHAWGGTTAYTLGRAPSVGVTGNHKNIYFGTGFSEGVPSTQTAGRIIADLMAGESNDFTNHFIVNRNIPYTGPKNLRGLFGRGVKWMIENLGFSPIH